ncbi:hypothetical protein HDU96_000063 [Phlyctochytrium bullatum]|nr:hypothetical protein HDU96_000063 [Phlyctochytrium bullatum]
MVRHHPAYIKSVAHIQASAAKETLGKLVEGGMNVCRLNLSHCSHEFAQNVIANLRAYIEETNNTAEVGIWIDINGPKVRSGKLKEKNVFLKAGDDFYFVNDENLTGDNTRGINFPSYVIEELPAVSAKDAADIRFAISQGVDFISVSCIRNIEDIEEVRMLLGNSKIKLLAKIENKRGMDNFDSILKLADGIVVDRGYLGAEVDVEVVTMAQKRMIVQSLKANAVMDGADGLVLSGETAVGSYVFESLDTMRRIAHQAEKNTNYLEFQVKMTRSVPKPISVSESIASSAVLAAHQVNAAIIVCITELGGTARLVAKYRAQIPVVAATLVKQTARQMAATFGLVPYYHAGDEPDNIIHETVRYAYELGLCKPGDIAVITSGQSVGFLEGTTTKMQLYPVPNFEN